MVEYTRPATWEDVKRLARHLEETGAELEPDSDVFAGQRRYAIRVNDEFTVDVLPSAAAQGRRTRRTPRRSGAPWN